MGRVGTSLSGLVAWVRPRPAEADGTQRAPGARVAREQYHRSMLAVIAFWAVAVCVAAAFSPIAAFGVAVLGIAHVIAGYRVEQHRRARGPGPTATP